MAKKTNGHFDAKLFRFLRELSVNNERGWFEVNKERYQAEVEKRITSFGCDVISAGLVDTAPKGRAAGDLFAEQNVDLIVCYVATYATSSTVLPAVQRRRAPVLILNLQLAVLRPPSRAGRRPVELLDRPAGGLFAQRSPSRLKLD